MAEKKKIIGSVAVDSETGMETYDVPKKIQESKPAEEAKPDNSPTAPPQTPQYRTKTEGDTKNLAGVPEEFMQLFEHDPSEIILKQALKHSIGVWFIYAAAILAVVVILGTMGLLFTDNSLFGSAGVSEGAKGLGFLVALIVSGLILVIAIAAKTVYQKSRMILTNQKIVFIQYHSLFSREVSQLNIGEVEDVNVAQRSIWDRIFKKGSVTIETAGEQNNYVFTHVANPHDFARVTIQAHEGSIAEYGN